MNRAALESADQAKPVPRDGASKIVVLKICVALAFAVLIPSPFGGWPPISLLLWGLVGDPQSGTQTIAFIFGGAALLAAYTAAIFAVITVALDGVALALRRARHRTTP